MLDTRVGRIAGFLFGLGLLVAALVLFRAHREAGQKEIMNFDAQAAKEIYQDRVEQTKMIMSEAGGN